MADLNFTNEPNPVDTDRLVGFKQADPRGERTFSLGTLKGYFGGADALIALAAETAAREAADALKADVTALESEENARVAADALLIPLAQRGAPSGVATLDAGGKVPTAQLPGLALTETITVADSAARLALLLEDAEGKIVVQADTGVSYGLIVGGDPAETGDWVSISDRDIAIKDVSGLGDALTEEAEARIAADPDPAVDAVALVGEHMETAVEVERSFGELLLTRNGNIIADRFVRRLRAGCHGVPWDSQITFSPFSEGLLPESPTICRDNIGRILVLWGHGGSGAPIDPELGSRNTAVLARSNDEGLTWSEPWTAAQLKHTTLFRLSTTATDIYAMGLNGGFCSIAISKSSDHGDTWSEPAVLFDGGDTTTAPDYHTSSVPVVIAADGYIYRAYERKKNGTTGSVSADIHPFDVAVVRCLASADLMNSANWEISNWLAWDVAWETGTVWESGVGADTAPNTGNNHWLEANAVEMPNGDIKVLVRTTLPKDNAVLLDLDTSTMTLSFNQMVRMPGGHGKFSVARDPLTNKFVAAVNPYRFAVTGSGDRNWLAMFWSEDLITWHHGCEIARDRYWQNHYHSKQRSGFQYPSLIIDGMDLLVVARTSYLNGRTGITEYHDANRITFHRVRDFRALISEL